MDFYPFTIVRQLLKTDEATYYSCRAPNGGCVLVVESGQFDFATRITSLQERFQEVMESIGFAAQRECGRKTCNRKRDCFDFSFLPEISQNVEFREKDLYMLKYNCFEFGKLVSVSDLAKSFHITIPSAYRLSISLLTLVEHMVRLNTYIEISVDNLLIDPESAMVTLIDWAGAELFTVMPIQKITNLYTQVTKLILKLTGAWYDETNEWHCPTGLDIRYTCAFLNELKMFSETKVEMPERLNEAIDYMRELRKKQAELTQTIVKMAINCDLEAKYPAFEVVKVEEDDNG